MSLFGKKDAPKQAPAKAQPAKQPAADKSAKGKGKGKGDKKKEPDKPRPLALGIPDQTGIKPDKRTPDWKPGQYLDDQNVDGDGDGTPIQRWLDANTPKGQTQQQFLDHAVANIRARGAKNGSDLFQNVPDLHSADDVKGLLDGIYARYPKNHDASDQIFAMWQAAGAKHDPSGQYQTSLRSYTGQTKKERVWDPSQHAWVDAEAPVMEYIDPKTFPYLVRNDAPIGSIFKATFVDAKHNVHETYLMVADSGTNRAEMSQAGLDQLGISGSPDGIDTPNAKVKLEYLGQGDLSKMPTAESVRADGTRLEGDLKKQGITPTEKPKPAPKKKKAGGDKKKQANAQTQGGRYYIAQVPDHGVRAGQNQLLVAVANPACLHSGNEPVVTGSRGIFVGRPQSPLSGEGDLTEDDLAIKQGTGDQTIIIT